MLMATSEEENQSPRLYTRALRYAVDIVAQQHQGIHAELDDYGRWCRDRYQPKECESIEGRFDQGEGGRKVRPPLITLPENPRHRQIDKVVRYMRMEMNRHGEAIRMFYVGVARPGRVVEELCSPRTICRALHMRYEDFPAFMFDARSAVINLLRRQGA